MSKKSSRREMPVVALDPVALKAVEENNAIARGEKSEAESEHSGMLGAILKSLNNQENKAVRMAFEVDPQANYVGAHGIYQMKSGLTPDHIIKRITGPQGNELVNQILQARSNIVGSFGRPRTSRFAVGMDIDELSDINLSSNPERAEAVRTRILEIKKILWNCGIDGIEGETQKPNLSQFLKVITRDGISYGRFAVEFLYQTVPGKGERLYAFRAVDAGTIYRIHSSKESDQGLRQQAIRALERLKNKKIDAERFKRDEYKWIQVIEGKPQQAFTEKELVVYNLYPVSNVEYNGYPLTPIDQALNAISTHISITLHNKLYFQHGRAARGMLVFRSDSIDEPTLQKIRLQFHQSINSVNNAWRMPVFGVGTEDQVQWQPIDQGGRDAEFQYLVDSNARVILSAFQMSPEELPGYAHLARGTNTQALCLDLNSKVFIKDGQYSLGAILGEDDEVYTQIWTGTEFQNAKVFRSGIKRRIITKFSNSTHLITSPDHQFLTINNKAETEWKTQRELQIGDAILINKMPVTGQELALEYNGIKVDEKFAELLGWMIGDGNIHVRYTASTGNIKSAAVTLFYNHANEIDIWNQHFELLQKYNISVKHKNRTVSEIERNKILNTCKWNTVAPNRLTNVMYDTKFVKWLLSIGFTSSTEGKSIPPFMYTAPTHIRAAFLRGFFSADGTKTVPNEAPRIVIHDDQLREQTKYLLLSLGVRVQNHEGNTVIHPKYLDKDPINKASYLCVRDKHDFYNKIGFLQSWKQPSEKIQAQPHTYNKVPQPIAQSLVRIILAGGNLSTLSPSEKSNLHTVLNVNANRTCTLAWVKQVAQKTNTTLPAWADMYHVEEVTDIIDTGESIEMADVEVFDDRHAFVANGVIVHNSESSNEWKLTAARDVGLRPLLYDIQDFLNTHVLPRIDSEITKTHHVVLAGLDKDSPEKESTRLQQDMAVHLTYNDIMKEVEKPTLPKELGADLPLNPQFQAVISQFLTVGEILENFFGRKGASQDPRYQYVRDPFWMQYQQIMIQKAQAAIQQQMAQQQQMMMAQQQPQEGDSHDHGDEAQSETPPQPTGDAEEDAKKMEAWVQSFGESLNKAVKSNHTKITKVLLNRHRELVHSHLDHWKQSSKKALEEISKVLEDDSKKKEE